MKTIIVDVPDRQENLLMALFEKLHLNAKPFSNDSTEKNKSTIENLSETEIFDTLLENQLTAMCMTASEKSLEEDWVNEDSAYWDSLLAK